MNARNVFRFELPNLAHFEKQLMAWTADADFFALLHSNPKQNDCHFSKIYVVGSLSHCQVDTEIDLVPCKTFVNSQKDWRFVAIAYDFKNLAYENYSEFEAELPFPKFCVFVPKYVFVIEHDVALHTFVDEHEANQLIDDVLGFQPDATDKISTYNEAESLIGQPTYVQHFSRILEHIQQGDFYEINYCFPFISRANQIKIQDLYDRLNAISEAPFSGIFKWKNLAVISSSPERFLRKTHDKLISQPIKGTTKRDENAAVDFALKSALQSNEKERAENVMIVDLVRNDLSKLAQKGSVAVEELCEVYTFKQVHQMISTVACELKPELDFFDILQVTFPMGSMTGAPKIEAMKWIDIYEKYSRGMYSGSFGYIAPNDDFDLNVIIRSLLCDIESGTISFSVGSAITAAAVAEEEFAECQLKAKAMLAVLGQNAYETQH